MEHRFLCEIEKKIFYEEFLAKEFAKKKYIFLKLKETQIRFEVYVQDKYFMDEMNYYGKKRLVLHVFRDQIFKFL